MGFAALHPFYDIVGSTAGWAKARWGAVPTVSYPARDGGHASLCPPYGLTLRTTRSARRLRRPVALVLHDDLVERAEIGFGGRHQRIRIGALRRHRAAFMGEPHRNFGLRVGAFGHGMDLIQLQLGLVRYQRLD